MLKVNEYSEEERKKIKEYFLKSLDNGVSITKASEAAGITRVTIWQWRKDDIEFDNEVNSILDSRIQIVEDALFLNATEAKKSGDTIAQIFYLKNRSKGRWKDKTEAEIDITHKGLDYEEYKKIKEMNADERNLLIDKLSRVCRDKNDKLAGDDQTKDK